jgi:hypothetical protein
LALAGVMREADEALDTLLVWDLLESAFRMTEPELRGHLDAAGVRDDFRVFGRLSARQRDALAASVER